MAAILTSPMRSTQPHHLEPPTDDESQRGRKRRRSSGTTPPAANPSTGSTTLRGRCRHRSLSQTLAFTPSSPSPSLSDEKRAGRSAGSAGSPRRKFMKKHLVVPPEGKRRRSQSPSRSRSGNGKGGTPKPRRRQRTRSRSRCHRVDDGSGGENLAGDGDVVSQD